MGGILDLSTKKISESPGKRGKSKAKKEDTQKTQEQHKIIADGKFTCQCTICIEQTKPEYFNQLDVFQNQAEVRE
jgi:hypothetical protein